MTTKKMGVKKINRIKEFNNGVWNAGGGPETSISPAGFLVGESFTNKRKLNMIRLKINEIIERLNE